MKDQPLKGKSIVVTRPAHQAQAFARLVTGAGGRAILFPAIEIRDIEDPGPFVQLVDRLDEFDLAVFVSPNAVERAMSLISARRKLPRRLQVATVGGGSVRALERFGVTGILAPQGRSDSEALAELPALAAVSGRRVVIFRGAGGREALAETLRARGATVEYAECYRRVRPEFDAAPLLEAWARKGVDAVTVTSSEGLRNFADMIGPAGRERLPATPLFVPHPRIAEAAHELGVRKVIVTGPGDDGMLTGLTAYFAAAR
ncbi:MAG TPA: uroporphyrinogen-III synthase [Burkholderiales bacterium]|jgi:uroporphyrinogen-III synthase